MESSAALAEVVVVVAMNTVVTHVAARAFRMRKVRHEWQAREGQEVHVLADDEMVRPWSKES